MKIDGEGLGTTTATPCVKCSDGWICEQHPEKGGLSLRGSDGRSSAAGAIGSRDARHANG